MSCSTAVLRRLLGKEWFCDTIIDLGIRVLQQEEELLTDRGIHLEDLVFSFELKRVADARNPSDRRSQLLSNIAQRIKSGTVKHIYFPVHIESHWVVVHIHFGSCVQVTLCSSRSDTVPKTR